MNDSERIKAAIGYEPISVSIDGYPQIRQTYRTVTDRDALVERLLPVLAEVRAEAVEEFLLKRDRPVIEVNTPDMVANLVTMAKAEARRDIARRIFELEQEVQKLLTEGDPTDARLNGALSALQYARDIAEGVTGG